MKGLLSDSRTSVFAFANSAQKIALCARVHDRRLLEQAEI